MKYLFTFIIWGFFLSAFAQTNKYNKSLKINNQTTYNQSQLTMPGKDGAFKFDETTYIFEWLKPTFAFRWQGANKPWGHEIEINTLRAQKSAQTTYHIDSLQNKTLSIGFTGQIGQIACRYETQYVKQLPKFEKISLVLGMGSQPFVNWHKLDFSSSNSFPSRATTVGITAQVMPGITYQINPKCYALFNVPISLFTVSYTSNSVLNPAFSAAQQNSNTLNMKTKEQNLYTRIGIGINL